MNTFLLLTIVLGVSIQQICKKAYNIRITNGTFSFSAASALFAAIFFVATSGGSIIPPATALPYSILFSLSYIIATVSSMLAISTGPLSLTSLILQYSLVLPALYGIVMLDEEVDILLISGIVLLLISILFINKEDKGEKKKITLKWSIFAFLSFLGNGCCSIIQKEQQLRCDGMYKNEFMILSLIITFVVLAVYALCKEKDNTSQKLKKGFIWFAVCGLANGLVNFLVLVLSTRMPASVMFPVISAGGIVITAAVSIFVYKEKLSLSQKIGMILGTFAIIILSI